MGLLLKNFLVKNIWNPDLKGSRCFWEWMWDLLKILRYFKKHKIIAQYESVQWSNEIEYPCNNEE